MKYVACCDGMATLISKDYVYCDRMSSTIKGDDMWWLYLPEDEWGPEPHHIDYCPFCGTECAKMLED